MIRSVQPDRDPLRQLADAAGGVDVPGDPDLDRSVQTALLAAGSRQRRRRFRRQVVTVSALCGALVVVGVGLWRSAAEPVVIRESVPAPAPVAVPAESRLALPTGDRILRVGEGSLAVEQVGPHRRFLLSAGEALFDVPRLGDGESFEVQTPDALVRVLGTVFSVDVEDDRSRVHVFEGEVQVRLENGEEHILGRGETYDTDGTVDWNPRILEEGEVAAQQRMRVASVEPAEAPSVMAARAPSMVARAEPSAAPTVAEVRRWLEEGEVARALAAAERGAARAPENGGWHQLLGDALRRDGQRARAADAYDQAASRLPASRATQAGYLAAEIRLRAGDAAGALRSLDVARSSDEGSPIEERAFALRVRAEVAAGQLDQARRHARHYLVRFPSGAARSWMLQLTNP
ncbi:MAG: FecR domain-containing protein [Myxococcota bacterium]